MKLLSLDQSSKITGYAIFEDSKLIKYNKFEFSDVDIGQRLLKIRDKIRELIQQYNIDEVVFEDIQQQDNVRNNVQTFKVLAMVYGVIAELLTRLQIPHSTLLASSWKSTLGIKGKTRAEQKRNAQQYVLDKYNIKVVQDTADSICLGEAYLQQDDCAWAN